MELVGGFLDEEWESLSKMFSGGENPDSLLQCGGGGLFPAPYLAFSEDSYLLSHTFDTNLSSISEESSNTSEMERTLFSNEDHQQYVHDNASFGFCNNGGLMMPVFSDDAMEQILNSTDDSNYNQIKRKYNDSEDQISPNKIPPGSRNARKNGKKKKIEEKNNEEESKSSCSSEDDSNELNGGSTSESKRKKKPSRGSATDPQSLYARKRRERINERLKILQGLVPNGTKVDISTMLEEAVQYVKFLQLQIKLLSSDDLWMYAPIAYNGMDIGMYQNISPSLRLQIN